MSDRLITPADTIRELRQRVSELEEQAAIFGVERDQAEAALTEARARLKAADRMADIAVNIVRGTSTTKELLDVVAAYRKETGQ